MKSSIFVKNQFVAYHRWVNAPDKVAFLRSVHRHTFLVKTWFKVNHNDRDLEFFMLQEDIEVLLRARYEGKQFEKSCETIAEELLEVLQRRGCFKVEVSEDGENGGVVEL